MECIENQIIASGIDIDGGEENSLTTPLQELKEKHPLLSELRPLNYDNAVMWCREIGLMDNALKQYWPAIANQDFEFIYGKGTSKKDRASLKEAVDEAVSFFKKYDIEITATTKVIYAREQSLIPPLIVEHFERELKLEEAQFIIRDQCEGQQMSALNMRGIIVFCTAPGQRLSDQQKRINEVMVHELAHEINRQMAGYISTDLLASQLWLDFLGPRWLAEATASVFEYKYGNPAYGPDFYIGALNARRPYFSGYKLASMIDNRSTFEFDFGSYVLRASQFLIRGKEETVIFDFWRKLARKNWTEAFEETFGQSTEDFYFSFSYLNPVYEPLTLPSKKFDPAVLCVQIQLSRMGINVGKPDGILGKRTLAGVRKAAQRLEPLQTLRAFNKDTAIAWCHEIALIDPLMWRSTPSFLFGEYNFIFADELDEEEKLLLLDMTYFAHRVLRSSGIFLPGTVDIIYGRNVDNLRKAVEERGRDPDGQISQLKRLEQLCQTEDRPYAIFGSDGHFVVCMGKEELTKENREQLRGFIADSVIHQLLHETQFQYGGYLPKNASAETYVQRRGPVWAVEGTTISLLARIANASKTPQELIEMQSVRKNIDNPAEIKPFTIVPLEEHFDFGVPAFLQLADRPNGFGKHILFWRQLARENWQSAFNTIYGEKPAEFYKSYRPPLLSKKDETSEPKTDGELEEAKQN